MLQWDVSEKSTQSTKSSAKVKLYGGSAKYLLSKMWSHFIQIALLLIYYHLLKGPIIKYR